MLTRLGETRWRWRRIPRQVAAVARTTHIECMQQPAVLLLTVGGVFATALIPLLQFHQFGEPGRLARDGALAYQLTLGLVMAVVATSSAIHAELANGTASAALSKPLARGAFLVGKFAGVLRMLFLFWACMLAALLLAERVAYRTGLVDGVPVDTADPRAQAWLLLAPPLALAGAGLLHFLLRLRFCLSAIRLLAGLLAAGVTAACLFDRAGLWHPSWSNLALRVVPVSLPILGALTVFAALATALATRLRAGLAMIVCLLVLLLGLSADTLLSPALPPLVRLPARLIPNIQSFWLCDALADGGTIGAGYLAALLLYASTATAAALAAGIIAFRNRDIH
ncbi:MAG: hypothetical protein GX590_08800 [Lentisphaerae bacterium]|nr:hypothetical protein [Lentisphaerota bacterium]